MLLDNALTHGAGVVELALRPGQGGGAVIAVGDEGPGVGGDPEAIFSATTGRARSRAAARGRTRERRGGTAPIGAQWPRSCVRARAALTPHDGCWGFAVA